MAKSRASSKKRLRLHLAKLKSRDYGLVLLGAVIVLTGALLMSTFSSTPVPLAAQTTTITTPWIPENVKQWQPIIQDMARKYNLDPNIIAIIMTVESGGNQQARSPVGAQGLMQIMPGTAADIAAKYLKIPVEAYDIYEPRTNIEFGTAYLAHLRDEFGTNTQAPNWDQTAELIAAGYNGGPGAASNLEKGLGLESSETHLYTHNVYNMWRERNAQHSPTYTRLLERGNATL